MRGRTRLMMVFPVAVLAAALAAGSSGTAHAAYGQDGGQLDYRTYQALAEQAVRQQPTQQPAGGQVDPLAGIQKVKITDKNIVVTLDAPNKKNHRRDLVIDFSELVPGTTSSQAGSGGGRSPLFYAIWGLVALSVLGRARRMVRRVVRR